MGKKEFDKKNSIYYNTLNKRAVGQLLPDRQHVKAIQKVAPYFSRAGALLFFLIVRKPDT